MGILAQRRPPSSDFDQSHSCPGVVFFLVNNFTAGLQPLGIICHQLLNVLGQACDKLARFVKLAIVEELLELFVSGVAVFLICTIFDAFIAIFLVFIAFGLQTFKDQ